MKIICLQENLKNALSATERIIGRNLTLPILNNVLLKTDKGRLRVSSTNLEIGINYWGLAKIEKEGEITVPAKILSSVINNLPNKKIELESKDDVLFLKCEHYQAKIKGQDAKDFPIIPQVQSKNILEIDQRDLGGGLNQVAGTASVSETRPEISGILCSIKKNVLKLAATDSFRLAEKTLFIKNNFEDTIILPQRTALEIIRILSEAGDLEGKNSQVKLIIGPGQIMVEMANIQLVSRLIDGQYPDYQQIIPNSFQTKITLKKEEIIKDIKIASLFSSKINDVRVLADPKKKDLEIFAQSADVGENKSQVPAAIDGKALDVAFNWRYLLDGFNNISSQKVFIGMNNDSAPTVIKPLGDESYVYVVMPIKAA